MVKVKAGERKKRLIVDTCKKLFYYNGYQKTTYDMICAAADTAPGSITYHFSGKRDLAALIAQENDVQLRRYVSGFVDEEAVGHWAYTVVTVWTRWFMFFSDPNLRRFYSELYTDSSHLRFMVNLLKVHQKFCAMDQTEDGLYLLSSTLIGQDWLILKMLEEDPDRFSLEEIVDYCITTMFKLIGLEPETAKHAQESGAELFRRIRDKLDLSYFKEFRFAAQNDTTTD